MMVWFVSLMTGCCLLLLTQPIEGQVKLIPEYPGPVDQFGYSVDVDGNLMVVGAMWSSRFFDTAGAVMVFQDLGTSWSQVFTLAPPTVWSSGLRFGESVSLSGDTFVVGAPMDDAVGPDAGAAYVFSRSGSDFVHTATLTAPDAAMNNQFGKDVAIYGDTIVVGADYRAGGGAAYVFQRSGLTWTFSGILTASDSASRFGISVAIYQHVIVVGAAYTEGGLGAAYVFQRYGSVWTEVQKLVSNPRTQIYFGISVAVHEEVIVVGGYAPYSSGQVCVFRKSGLVWVLEETLTSLSSGGHSRDRFGYAVDVELDLIVVGANYDATNGAYSGAAYVFQYDGASFGPTGTKLLASDGAYNDQFGFSVSASSSFVAVGAPGDDVPLADVGSVHIFGGFGSTETLHPTVQPTRNPTVNPTKSPTRNPTVNPTKSPTRNPTVSPTKSPTRNPTVNPTKSPTLSPTLSPTPFSNCTGADLLLAIDTSFSIKSFEFERQKQVIQVLFDFLSIGPEGVGIAMTSFGMTYSDRIPIANIQTTDVDGGRNETFVKSTLAEYFANLEDERIKFTNFLPLFDDDRGVALAEGSERPTILILSDGEPFTPTFRGKRKSTRIACSAANDFRQAYSHTNILCFQSDNKSKSKEFFKCACDAIWLAKGRRSEDFRASRVALEIVQNHVCVPNTRSPDPCEGVNELENLSLGEKQRRCRQTVRDSKGRQVDPDSVFDYVPQKQCFWSRRKCRVLSKYAPLYDSYTPVPDFFQLSLSEKTRLHQGVLSP